MYDIDIQRIVYSAEAIKEKTIFIERLGLTESEIESSIQCDFGTVLPIGINGFWHEFDKIHSSYIPQDTSATLFCFEEIKAPTSTKDFRDDFVFDLLLKGVSDIEFVWNEVHGSSSGKYFTVRDNHHEVLNSISQGIHNVISFSDMANGKTLFIQGLVCGLISKGYRAFWLKDESENVTDEINYITSLKTPTVVVIENYARRLDEIRFLELKKHPELILMLSAKTSTHEMYQDDILEIIEAKHTIDVDLNYLSDIELSKLNDILTTYKLWGERDAWGESKKLRFLSSDCQRHLISGVLLEIVKSPNIQSRFHALFNTFKDNSTLTDVVVTASILKLLGFDTPKESMISELIDSNYLFSLEFKRNPTVKELVSLGSGNVIPRSSVLAKYGLTSFVDSRALVDRLIKIATNAHDRGRDSELYFGIYKDLVTFSSLQSMLPEKGKRDASIRFYEAIKNLTSARYHPHFWLQYAIARLASDGPDDLAKAKLFLDSAYAHAQNRKNYHTKHMDNVKARYLIKHSATIPEINAAVIELHDGHSLLLKQCRTEQSIAPYKVAKHYLSFYNSRKTELNAIHKDAIVKFSRQILENIQKLNSHLQTEQAVKFCRTDLESLIADIQPTSQSSPNQGT